MLMMSGVLLDCMQGSPGTVAAHAQRNGYQHSGNLGVNPGAHCQDHHQVCMVSVVDVIVVVVDVIVVVVDWKAYQVGIIVCFLQL